MTTAKNVMKMIKDNDVKYVDFRFTDPRGKWQHVTFDVSMIEEDTFAEGQAFDGSSIAGWKAINESDMNLMPDPALGLHRSVFPPKPRWCWSATCSSRPPASPTNRDPARHLQKSRRHGEVARPGRHIYFGPEAEFFVFDDVKYKADPYNTGFKVDSIELPSNSDTDYEGGNLGHRIGRQEGLLPGAAAGFGAGHALGNARRHGAHGRQGRKAPSRSGVRPARTRPEVLADDADGRHDAGSTNTASSRSRRSTARPRPSCRSRSTATTVRACTATSRSGRPASRSSPATNTPTCRKPACSTSPALIKHAKAINAFTNPTTNSYKRLVPGFEAPVLLAYSARNRSASCRIPYTTNPKAKRVEVRFPDSAVQPLSRLLGAADGRPRRHQETSSIRARRWTRTSTTCRRRN